MKERDAVALFMQGRRQQSPELVVDVGDDAAVLNFSSNQSLVVSIDTSIAGCHFLEEMPPHAIGYRCCQTAISDIYAMGATPKWALVALSVPKLTEDWMVEFRDGFWASANQHQVDVIGGDLTKGPMSCTVHVMGVASKNILCQGHAKLGDEIWVNGSIGGSAWALHQFKIGQVLTEAQWQPYRYPVVQGIASALIPILHSATDVTDGIVKDVQALLPQDLGIEIDLTAVPWHPDVPSSFYLQALESSDDFGLAVSAPIEMHEVMHHAGWAKIGVVTEMIGCWARDANGEKIRLVGGYEHFIET
jgi:thiamine-monophosphate kinase